jgi:hypothetical protein
MSQQQPAHKRWCDAQGASILGGTLWTTSRRTVDHTRPLSTEYIITQLQQLRDLVPAPEGHD